MAVPQRIQLTKHAKDISGQKFNRLTAKFPCGYKGKKQGIVWWCACECGKELPVLGNALRGSHTKSCGCLQREQASKTALGKRAKGGDSMLPHYQVHRAMIRRCTNPNDAGYHNYGERGVSICGRWLGRSGLRNFIADVGPIPAPGMTIERKDNDGSYEPGNVRWATRKEQAENRRDTRFIIFNDVMLCVKEWSRRCGFGYDGLLNRLNKRLPIAHILEKAFV